MLYELIVVNIIRNIENYIYYNRLTWKTLNNLSPTKNESKYNQITFFLD